MPLPRKSIVGKTKKKSITRKKSTATSRARKGERLLVTCAPIVTDYIMDDLAQTLHGSFFTDPDGCYQQIVAVRIDERAQKIYGKCQEMYEAAPYMFAPVEQPQK
jgi:hypothetical protein